MECSALFYILFLRCSFILAFAFLINKYHKPLHARTQPSAWVPLSAAFPVCTLLVLRQVYTYPEEQRVWQICLLILDLVDIAALILLDYLEENAENREKLIAANERAHVQDENIQALSQAYGERFGWCTETTVTVEQLMCIRMGFNCSLECVKHNRVVVVVTNNIRNDTSVVQVKDGTQIDFVNSSYHLNSITSVSHFIFGLGAWKLRPSTFSATYCGLAALFAPYWVNSHSISLS